MKAIAIDLGGTSIRAAVVDREGQILSRSKRATPAQYGVQAVINQIKATVEDALKGFDVADIAGVGLASPGPIDTIEGVALGLPNFPGFDNVPIRQLLAEALRRDVKVENDAIAAAIGEWRFGAGRGSDNLVYITVSTGIGGGVIADGRVLRGRRGMACHVGHLGLFPDRDVYCNCGNRGCWEAFASGTAFEKRARERQGLGVNPDAPSVFAAARQGNSDAIQLVAEEAHLLGLGIISLLHLYSPDRVILGGGLSHHFDLLKPGIIAEIKQYAMLAFRSVELLQAEQVDNSGLLGAAALVFGTA
jgi:glucokinase